MRASLQMRRIFRQQCPLPIWRLFANFSMEHVKNFITFYAATQFEKSATYIGDELDLLAFYIDTGFNVGEAEFNGRPLLLWGMSKLLDPYFMRGRWRKSASKPRRRLTQWWADILRRIEEKQVPRWTELGSILLNLAYDGQVAFEKRFKRLQKTIQNNSTASSHGDATTIMIGPPQRRDAIVGFSI